MSIDLTGITNKNEYYTNHYFSTVFEENTSTTISNWNAAARESEEIKTPWSLLRQNARQYYTAHDKFVRSSVNLQVLANIKALAGNYLKSLGYPEAKPEVVAVDDSLSVPVYLEMTKSNGAPLLWVLLSASKESDAGIMESFVFNADDVDDDAAGTLYKGILGEIANEDLVTKILFGTAEPPRFVMLIGMNSSLFERLLLTRGNANKEQVLALAEKGVDYAKPEDIIKDPYVFEFLGLPEEKPFLESDLEAALVRQIEDFLLELGRGFMFVGTQQRVTVNNTHYYVDMVFYNKILHAYMLIELKTTKLTPEAAGQINMYLNYYAAEVNDPEDNPPIGIILCTDKDSVAAEYALGGLSNQIFASRYVLYMPNKEQLIKQVEEVLKRWHSHEGD